MSDLSATNCGCGNTCQNGGLFGGNSSLPHSDSAVMLRQQRTGANNGCGCNDGGNNGCNSLIWILLLLACCATAAAESARITAADATMAVDADSIGI